MYQFRPVTERILKIRDDIRNRVIRVDTERAVAITESYRRNEYVAPVIKRARATYDVLKSHTVRVEDDEIIVGNLGRFFCGSCVFPEWIWRDLDSFGN